MVRTKVLEARCRCYRQAGERLWRPGGRKMSITPISAAGLGQSVLASSNSTQLQQILQNLQHSLTTGDLNGAQSAFQSLLQVNQGLATASGSSASSTSQLSSDLTALGSAISAGNLSTAQSAFTTVQGDLKNATSPSLTEEVISASLSEQLVQGLLSPLDTSATSLSSTSDPTTSLLNSVYGTSGGLNITA